MTRKAVIFLCLIFLFSFKFSTNCVVTRGDITQFVNLIFLQYEGPRTCGYNPALRDTLINNTPLYKISSKFSDRDIVCFEQQLKDPFSEGIASTTKEPESKNNMFGYKTYINFFVLFSVDKRKAIVAVQKLYSKEPLRIEYYFKNSSQKWVKE